MTGAAGRVGRVTEDEHDDAVDEYENTRVPPPKHPEARLGGVGSPPPDGKDGDLFDVGAAVEPVWFPAVIIGAIAEGVRRIMRVPFGRR
jgi:hypothetical protein